MRLAVVIANLGGPDSLQAVRPFLFNLFNDRAIIGLPQPLRFMIAKLISGRRAPVAAKIYAQMGGASPILAETRAQGAKLEDVLRNQTTSKTEIRVFTAMRYWHPFILEAAQEVKAWAPDQIVLLPLYPQFSTTTTGSFFDAWDDAAARLTLNIPEARICCHPIDSSFVAAHTQLIREAIAKLPRGQTFRLLFSAHGLPKRVVERGDPYAWQIEETARAIVDALNNPGLDWRISYQSRVGPLAWLEPATETEIHRAGAEKKGLVVVPIAFVSEHSETLVELDVDYAALASKSGVTSYIRVPALGQSSAYIEGLARLALSASRQTGLMAAGGRMICPRTCTACPHVTREAEAHL